jgi:hypothetical protein
VFCKPFAWLCFEILNIFHFFSAHELHHVLFDLFGAGLGYITLHGFLWLVANAKFFQLHPTRLLSVSSHPHPGLPDMPRSRFFSVASNHCIDEISASAAFVLCCHFLHPIFSSMSQTHWQRLIACLC